MNYTPVVAIQSVYILISLFLYSFIFAYIMWSGDPEFKTAFHRLFLLRAPADFLQVLISLIAFRFPIAGWKEWTYVPHLAKLGFVISQYSVLVEMCAQLLLSVNRLSAIMYPILHNKFWTRRITFLLFSAGMLLSIIPTAIRFEQPATYTAINGSYVPRLINEGDQEKNSKITCWIYAFFGALSLTCNLSAWLVHRKQRRMQFFDSQPKLASTVQTNLLIYACLSTFVVIAMLFFQFLLASHVFDVKTEAHKVVVVSLTVSADAFALSNPWLLFCLSSTFRRKFLDARRIPRIFAAPSTNETS